MQSAGLIAGRFIPTYVGHTEKDRGGRGHGPVHPHIRGAYRDNLYHLRYAVGSSPHTWGIHRVEIYHVEAGAVHPHIRGAYMASIPGIPLVLRFIPTYVGHTAQPLKCSFNTTVHPHIRGAYFLFVLKSRTTAGSSPHTWGIRRGLPDLRPADRFIPTYVGHTHTHPCFAGARSVHPHIRGAYQ